MKEEIEEFIELTDKEGNKSKYEISALCQLKEIL